MKLFLKLVFVLICGLNTNAQLSYTFSTNTSVAFTPLTGATSVFGGGSNNAISGNIPIGFSFSYSCQTYTQVEICTEGWMGFGGGMIWTNVNDLTNSTRRPSIAPLWDDMRVPNNTGGISYRTTGTAPNRIFTVEWREMRWDDGAGNNNTGVVTFQASLFETTNNIEFHYRDEAASVSSGTASIGLAGSVVGNFYSVNAANAVSTVTETTTISARPTTNRRYIFTALPSCSGTPTAGSANSSVGTVTCGSPAVNFTVSGGSSGCGISYQWQSSPNNSTWTNISGATAATYSSTVLSTTYYRRVTTCSGSGLSANSSSVLVTFNGCTGTPASGTASSSVSTTNCTTNAVTFTLTGASTGCGITYQWQYSLDNATWFNITGATATTYSTNVLGTTYFRCRVTCASNGLIGTSNTLTITSSGMSPSNDLPCNSINVTLGAASSGNNVCSSNVFEPSTPSCWTGGTVNTVWYNFVAPASGTVKIKTIISKSASILQRTQIAVYSGACNSLTEIGCNEDAPSCGGFAQNNSELTLIGLTPGQTYLISVDGENNDVGDFSILVINGTGVFPPVPGQDCPVSFTLCNPTTTIGNPGYQGIGSICDQNGSGNCTNGEANSVWYLININPLLVGTTPLNFDIVPNDYGNPNPITGQANPGYSTPGNESDYDFLLYKVAGTGSTTCAGIQSGAAPVVCNYSSLGLSGCSVSGNSPAAYPGFNASYEVSATVSAGDIYILVVQNFSNSVSGFTIQFPLTSPVVYTPPTTVYWTGGNFTNSFTNSGNWGGCNAPTCGISAFVTPSSSNQPVLTAGTYAVQNITINSGASLTLQSGATLQVCGNFTNDGTLICLPGSTVEFIGTGVQTITGAFENTDGFFNFTVNKVTGSVVLANNIDVDGNFLTSNNTSILNTAGFQIRVGGNFTNAQGNLTFTNIGTTGTLVFSGTGAVTYTQGSQQLDLNYVLMNKTGAGTVTLNSNLFIKSVTGTLTLIVGKFITGANRVDVANGAATCVNGGNASSYIVGNLHRTLNGAAGSFEFPLGSTANYERANVTFTTATTIPRLLTRFDTWTGAPNTIGLTECSGNYILPAQNMGYWTLNASANPTSGTYNMTLYSTGATNTAGSSGWTIQKATTAAGPWSFNGICALSTVSEIERTAMNGFSVFGVAQSTTPLPIELIDFSGYRYNAVNVLKWTTVSELNSDYFNLEKSRNGKDFDVLKKVTALGNSNTPYDYTEVDETPFNGITYYRLNFFDLDGTNEYGKIIAVSSETPKNLKIGSIFPNPGNKELNMDYSVSKETNLNVSFADASGRILKSLKMTIKGVGTYTIPTSDLADGIYMFIVTDNDGFKEVHSWVKK